MSHHAKFHQNQSNGCRHGDLTVLKMAAGAVKKPILHQRTKFRKGGSNRYGDIAILKTVKSLYLCNRLTDFDEIWHNDAHWSPTAGRPLKFRIFENSRWQQPPKSCQISTDTACVHGPCAVAELLVLTLFRSGSDDDA